MLRFLGASLSALIGTGLVLLAVLGLNRPVPPPPPPKEVREVRFDLKPPERPPPRAPAPPPPRRAPPTPAPPAALLGASLSGLSFGLGAFQDLQVGTSALDGAGAGQVEMTEATVDVAPRPLQRTPPDYPVRARAKGLEGSVDLSIRIGEDGSVRDVQVLASDPAGVFDEAARDAVRTWRFEPALYQGQPVPVRVQQTLRFALE